MPGMDAPDGFPGLTIRTDPRVPKGTVYLLPPGHPVLNALDADRDELAGMAQDCPSLRREIMERAAQTAVIRVDSEAVERPLPSCEIISVDE